MSKLRTNLPPPWVTLSDERSPNAWSRRTYEMVAEVIRKVRRYDDGEVEGAASENERVRLIVAKLFADQFEADNAQFDRSRFLKACNNAR